jgi:hypothetical protein
MERRDNRSGAQAAWPMRACALALVLAWAAAATAGGVPASGSAKRKPVYMPPERGAPTTTVAAATRGGESSPVRPVLFAPAHTGLTAEPSPSLYWWLSGDFAGPVELTLLDDRKDEPVLELRLARGAKAGVHVLPLAEHGIVLKSGITYEWSVALVREPAQRSQDIFTSALLRRVPGPPPSKTADIAARLDAVARDGLWYDAVDLSSRIAERSGDTAARKALLEQVGLEEAAAAEGARR